MKTFCSSLVLFLALISNDGFSQTYQLTDLGVFVGTNSYAQGINNQSQVVGYWETLAGAHAFLYQAGTVTDLGLLGVVATNSYALSINDQGQVVGFAESTNGSSAFLYRDGVMTNLGTWSASDSYAYGISGDSHIVGYVATPNGTRASLYYSDNVAWLGTLGGTNSMAFSINDTLQVVGSSLTTNNTTTHAFLWQNGSMIDLNQLLPFNSGWELVEARGINESGQIVGWGQVNNQEHAFFYKSGSAADLGVLSGGSNSFAFGLNNSNSVVGTASSASGTHAFLWQSGFINDLNDLINPGSGWELREAWGINDSGQIVGWGVINGQPHAFLLTPLTTTASGGGKSLVTQGQPLAMIPLVGSPPTVSITNPVSNASFAAPTNLTINATASDSDGSVTQVQFLVGTRVLGIKTNSPYSVTWSNAPVGMHALTAVATDNTGLTGTSSVVNISISTNLLPIADAHVRDGSSTNINFGTNIVMECLTTNGSGNNRDIYFKFDLSNISSNIGSAKLSVFAKLGGTGSVSNTVYSVTNTSWLETNITWNNKPARVTALTTNSVTGTNWFLFDVSSFVKSLKNAGSNTVCLALHDPTNYSLLISINSRENSTNNPSLVIVTTNSSLSVSITNPINNALFAAPASITINASAADSDGTVTQVQFFQGTTNLGVVTSAPYNLAWTNVASGTYALTARASDNGGLVTTSSVVTVVVDIPPSISLQPTNQTVRQGSNAVFTVTAAGTTPLSYQWYFNGTNVLGGATNTSLTLTNVQLTNAGNYSVVITNVVGSVTSSNAVLAVLVPPSITAQPTNQMVISGGNVTFTVTAAGTTPLSYQWYFNGTNAMGGATNALLSLTGVTTNQTGNYSVAVSNLLGSVTSSNAVLTVLVPPVITTNPASQTVFQGSNAVFTVAATPTNNLSYQWYFNGAVLAGATNNVLTNASVQVTNAGVYYATVTNLAGSATSSNAYLTVTIVATNFFNPAALRTNGSAIYTNATLRLTPPKTNLVGSVFLMTPVALVSNASFSTFFSFCLNQSGGATNTAADNHVGGDGFVFVVQTLTNNLGTNAGAMGYYRLTNSVGVEFDTWRNTNEPPGTYDPDGNHVGLDFNGFLTNAVTFQYGVRSNGYSAVTTNIAHDLNNSNVWYAWVDYNGANSNLEVRLSETNSARPLAPLLAYANINLLDFLGARGKTNAYIGFTASTGGSYNEQDILSWQFIPQYQPIGTNAPVPPLITQQPVNVTTNAGGNATFSMTATGTLPLSYQWRYNTTNILAGATNASLTLTNVQTTNAGNYSVVVTNVAGSVTSSNGVLTVNVPPIIAQQPVNVTTNAGGNATFSVTMNTNSTPPLNYQWWFNATNLLAGATNGSLTLTNVQSTNAGNYSVVVTNVAGSVVSSNAVLTVNVPPIITQQPVNVTTNTGGNATFSVAMNTNSTLPLSYQWRYNTTNILAGATNASLTLTNVQTTNAGNYSVVVTNVAGSVTSSNGVLTVNVPPVITQQPVNVTTNAGGNATFSVTISTNSTPPLNYQWWFNAINILAGATNGSLTLTNVQSTNAGNYSVVVTNVAGSVTSSNGVLTVNVPPSITTQPTNQTVVMGSNVTLSVTATGTDPLNYQWYVGNVTNSGIVFGATNATLIFTNVQPYYANSYFAVVTNVVGSVTSSNGVLTVLAPPSITTQPTNQVVVAGDNATFSVTASGTTPLNYQWYGVNSGILVGATGATLSLSNVQPNNADSYYAVLTNVVGSVTSSNGVLTVLVPPMITAQPTNQAVVAGGDVTFSVMAAGTTPLSYQWYGVNSGILFGATNATLNLSNVQPNNADSYYAVVTNVAGSVTSSNGVLTVLVPPIITTQPTNQTVMVGGTANFSVTASGTTPLNYQWYGINSGMLVGATNATLTFSNVQLNNADSYYAVVTNVVGSVTSSNAVLTVLVPLTVSITNPPSNSGFFTSPTNITLTATASDLAGTISQVQFFQGTNSLGFVMNSPYSLIWSNASAGSYALMAVAVDNNGLAATSAVVNISIFGTNDLRLWLKADSITGLTNYAGVSTWPDSSGWTNNATQTANNSQPLYVTNAVNGCPIVRFNWTNGQYLILPNLMSAATQAEAFVVLKAAAANPTNTQSLWFLSDAYNTWERYPGGDGSIQEDFGCTSTRNLGVPVQPLTQYHVYEVSAQANNWAAWINGILMYQAFNNAVEFCGASDATYLGASGYAFYGYHPQYFFGGDIAEVLIFNRALTTSERTTVNGYLNGKYGLIATVPPPTNLVASAISQTQIGLTWNEVLIDGGGATQISIERKTGNGGTYSVLAQIPNVLSYVDTNLVAGTTYYYRIRAINMNLWSPYSNEANATTLSNGPDLPSGSLLLWLKADAGITHATTNTTVGLWLDQSGNGNNAQQGTGSQQPAWVPQVLGGLPAVHFNGASNEFLNLSNCLANLTQAEAFAVVRATPSGNYYQSLWYLGNSGNAYDEEYPLGDGTIRENFGSGSSYNLGVPSQPLNQFHIYEVSSQTNNWAAWVNGTLLYQTSNNVVSFSSSPTLSGSFNYYSQSTFFYGDMAEIMIFNRALTASERATVNTYLDGKYGAVLAVPPTPTNLVALAISPTQITLDWNEPLNAGVTQISIERAATSNGVFSAVAQASNTLAYIDTNLAAGTRYYYRIRAANQTPYFTSYSSYSTIVWATTPTNGVGLPLGSLAMWLRADLGVATNLSAQIGTWLDQSGNGHHATQIATNCQPAWIPAVLNGNPVVRFNGSNSYFSLPSFMNSATGGEAFVVLKVATNLPGSFQSLWEMGGDYGGDKTYPNTDGSIGDDFGSTTVQSLGIPTQPLTQFHVYEVSSQTNNWAAWINGVLQYQTLNNAVSFSAGPTLGQAPWQHYSGGWYDGDSYFAGDIAEVLVFSRTLTISERGAVNIYLDGKYGLVPVVPATPTNLVATAISPTQVALTWDEALNGGATQIGIERSTASNGVYQLVAQIPGATSYVDTNLTPGTTYYYQVQAINLTQWSPTSNVAQATTPTIGTNLPFGSLALWLKADAGLVQGNTNAPVNQWSDQSGNGNNAVQLATGYQPLWVPWVIGDRPVMRFNGTNSYFNLPSFMNGATGAEAFVVLKVPTNFPGSMQSLWEMGGDTLDGKVYPNTDGSISDDFGSAVVWYEGIPQQPLNQYHLYEVTSQANNWAAWINGILQYQTATNAVNFSAGPTLGRAPWEMFYMGWISENSFFAGDIAEVLIFDRGLTPDERTTVGVYLNGKYGLVPAVPATPTNLVATAISPTQVALSWNETLNAGATRVSVERLTPGSWTYQVVAQISGANSYVDTNVAPGTTYYYRVRAINIVQWSGYSNVAQTTTPTSGASLPFGSLALWLKADAGFWQSSTNTPINLWPDQSGNTNHAVQMSAANRPSWVPEAIGSQPAVQFNGTNSSFDLPTFLNGANSAEAFVVLKVTVTNSFQSLWEFGGDSWDIKAYPYTDGSIRDDFGSTSVQSLGIPAQSLTQYHVYEVSSQNDNWAAWINGVLLYQTSEVGFNTVDFSAGMHLGVTRFLYDDPSAPFEYYVNNYFAGAIAEILVFDRALTTDERATINNYLDDKYGLLAPIVSITSPANDTVFPGPTNISISATANDGAGIEQVQFFQGMTCLGMVTNTPYSLVWSNVALGSYALTACAVDNNGITFTSAVVNVTVGGIAITSPTNNTVLTAPANIPINATVVDGAGVSQVQFFQGTASLGIVTSMPYSMVWSNVTSGSYALTAVAVDNFGLALTSSIVNVTVDIPPGVTLTNPVNNARFVAGTNISLGASASDADGTIAQVQFFQGTNRLGISTGSPYSLVWSNAPAGAYALTARATDNKGLNSTSAVVNIFVAGIAITNPPNNVVLTAPANVSVGAAVTDNSGITQVQFFQGTTSLGTVTTAPYSVAWNGVGTGTYTLTAVATDAGGLVFTSSVVNVIVDADPNSSDRDGDGVSDNIEYLEGRNPLVSGAVPDTNGIVNFQVYTPLH